MLCVDKLVDRWRHCDHLCSVLCREIMHAMWKPVKFKYVYIFATLYVFTLTIPSAIAVYWAFGDLLLEHSNALSLLPRSGARDLAVVLMLIHQVLTVSPLNRNLSTNPH